MLPIVMFVQFTRAAEIAGLTEHQLKEWCMRRCLISPDVPPRGRGHNALFGWQTLLVLRLLSVVHTQFGGTVAHWGPALNTFRQSLQGVPFPALYGQIAAYDGKQVTVSSRSALGTQQPLLILPLDDHLNEISRALSPEQHEIQLSLLGPLLVKQ
jgi:hypothetical protein